eukprot:snap_masked-scaffold_3-processed-gene-2.7-mRNA-1 protein AED:1.00 eAED:1.00 QI:0/0/0/0/1/1/2/0/65
MNTKATTNISKSIRAPSLGHEKVITCDEPKTLERMAKELHTTHVRYVNHVLAPLGSYCKLFSGKI